MAVPTSYEPYDHNFCFPVPEKLESDRVALTPFIPAKHAEAFISQSLPYPEIFDYLHFGPFVNTSDFIENLIDARVQKDPGYVLFNVYDKTKPANADPQVADDSEHPGALAGLIGLLDSSTANLVTEVGCVMILPPFHRTHVASNAVGLLLHYALDLPTANPDTPTDAPQTAAYNNVALGLRRVVWQANVLNKPSIRLAERMGFTLEGVLRWHRVLPASKATRGAGNGKKLREGDSQADGAGRDGALLSLCWDDWEGGAREKVDRIMKRTK